MSHIHSASSNYYRVKLDCNKMTTFVDAWDDDWHTPINQEDQQSVPVMPFGLQNATPWASTINAPVSTSASASKPKPKIDEIAVVAEKVAAFYSNEHLLSIRNKKVSAGGFKNTSDPLYKFRMALSKMPSNYKTITGKAGLHDMLLAVINGGYMVETKTGNEVLFKQFKTELTEKQSSLDFVCGEVRKSKSSGIVDEELLSRQTELSEQVAKLKQSIKDHNPVKKTRNDSSMLSTAKKAINILSGNNTGNAFRLYSLIRSNLGVPIETTKKVETRESFSRNTQEQTSSMWKRDQGKRAEQRSNVDNDGWVSQKPNRKNGKHDQPDSRYSFSRSISTSTNGKYVPPHARNQKEKEKEKPVSYKQQYPSLGTNKSSPQEPVLTGWAAIAKKPATVQVEKPKITSRALQIKTTHQVNDDFSSEEDNFSDDLNLGSDNDRFGFDTDEYDDPYDDPYNDPYNDPYDDQYDGQYSDGDQYYCSEEENY